MADKTEIATNVTMQKLVSLCKQRGFIFQSSEIYGGLSSAWDYGPLGVELKNNIEKFWWKEMTQLHDNIVGLDAAIMMHPRTWEASGHVANFSDPMVDCKQCKSRFRADHIDLNAPCPVCGTKDSFTEPREFNLMFSTHMGPVKDDSAVVYLRPETAQGIFVNFKNVQTSSRLQVPFGIAQVGKAFRNEVTTKNFIFRTCEFEQMEMQFFVKPGSDDEWFEYWKKSRMDYYAKLGVDPAKMRFHEHGPDELAHYAKGPLTSSSSSPWAGRSWKGSIAGRTLTSVDTLSFPVRSKTAPIRILRPTRSTSLTSSRPRRASRALS
jgi:glycyl-tRNA synthetase